MSKNYNQDVSLLYSALIFTVSDTDELTQNPLTLCEQLEVTWWKPISFKIIHLHEFSFISSVRLPFKTTTSWKPILNSPLSLQSLFYDTWRTDGDF